MDVGDRARESIGLVAVAAALALGACGGDDSTPAQTVFGGDRPAELLVPSSYEPSQPAPLLLVLHGYSVSGAVELAYTRLSELVERDGVLVIAPDGTLDADGNLFWNVADSECTIGQGIALPDDLGYLIGLIDEVSAVWNVDPNRVYLFGHSNGGFMAHRLACDHADRIAAIVSLAGAPPLDAADCVPSEPVGVLQLHGDADDTVLYGGGDDILGTACPYPGAEEISDRWAGHDGCDPARELVGRLNLVSGDNGDETRAERHNGCGAATVQLWTMEGAGHIPPFRNDGYVPMWEFLSAHAKP